MASLASTHWMSETPLSRVLTTKNDIDRYPLRGQTDPGREPLVDSTLLIYLMGKAGPGERRMPPEGPRFKGMAWNSPRVSGLPIWLCLQSRAIFSTVLFSVTPPPPLDAALYSSLLF